MIQVTKAKVNLTEQTVRELLNAIEKAKEITTFTDKPFPEGDMMTHEHLLHKRERGEILVESEYTGIQYVINLEKRPHSQDSLGYHLNPGHPSKPPVEIGKDGRCMCGQGDKCPLGRGGMQLKCTKAELEAAGIPIKVSYLTDKK